MPIDPGITVEVPDGAPVEAAWARTRTLGVGAHPDDLELMALPFILAAAGKAEPSFAGVVVCDGSGSLRAGEAVGLDAAALAARRAQEQSEAARVGGYSALVQLGWPSAQVMRPGAAVVDQLEELLTQARPQTLLSHDLADRHATHVAVSLRLLEALRRLPAQQRPQRWLGCEVWRSLDWQAAQDRVALGLHGDLGLAQRLLAVHKTQVSGKGYLDAAQGRRRANASFADALAADDVAEAVLAMDLTPLLLDDALSPQAFLAAQVDRFRAEALARMGKLMQAR